ncbi:MAG: ATP-dependent DNA helicase RecG [Bdellovibrionales bacterium]|nr:ATP-dependent DNA helicase RecG [Bdellovibrionales bacterium]
MSSEQQNIFLRALDRPLRFLHENQLRNETFVKNLLNHIHKTSQQVKEKASLPIKNLFAKVDEKILDFQKASLESRKQTIKTILQWIDECEAENHKEVLYVKEDHQIYSIKELEEHQKHLQKEIQFVKGVGPVIAEKFRKNKILRLGDLLAFLPTRYDDRKNIKSISQLQDASQATVVGEIQFHGISYYRGLKRRVYEMVIEDGTSELKLKWFQFHAQSFEKKVKRGAKVIVSGKVKKFRNQWEMHHPDFEVFSGEKDSLSFGRIIPIYREIGNLYQKTLRKIMFGAATQGLAHRVCMLPPDICEKMNLLPPWKALEKLHLPQDMLEEDRKEKMERHLAFEELFFYTFALLHRKLHQMKNPGIAFDGDSPRSQKLLNGLPFALTDAQLRVLGSIEQDMKQPYSMNRLIQGDVGSGKTIVALLSALRAIDHGYQVSLMAPTELLAEQHYKKLTQFCESLNLRMELILGKMKKSEKDQCVRRLEQGEIDLLIGTHALLTQNVNFKNLGLVIVDEQHRFGVRQKESLREKATQPDVLIMSATPIPRTLALTIFGDLDVSVIDQMPAGRKPIQTQVKTDRYRKDVYEAVRACVKRGEQVYMVYPLVESSKHLEAKDAKGMAELFSSQIFPDLTVGLIHGQLKAAEKESVMQDFVQGSIQVLVSTTVIEVGIDVPNATMMVIEHPERFGLSQLHQLRGRVGRGHKSSSCVLLLPPKVSKTARDRLKIFEKIHDGFTLAEEDLKLRGPGDFFGVAQSGMPYFSCAQFPRDMDLMEKARREAARILDMDPSLTSPGHKHLEWVIQNIWKERLRLAQIG